MINLGILAKGIGKVCERITEDVMKAGEDQSMPIFSIIPRASFHVQPGDCVHSRVPDVRVLHSCTRDDVRDNVGRLGSCGVHIEANNEEVNIENL